MSKIRADISDKKKYWISKNRYYELRHFCLQYREFKNTISGFDSIIARPPEFYISHETSNPTEKCAILRLSYTKRTEMIEAAAVEADPELAIYILKGVTEDRTYENLKTVYEIPCSRGTYYNRYRKFFWLLDKKRE